MEMWEQDTEQEITLQEGMGHQLYLKENNLNQENAMKMYLVQVWKLHKKYHISTTPILLLQYLQHGNGVHGLHVTKHAIILMDIEEWEWEKTSAKREVQDMSFWTANIHLEDSEIFNKDVLDSQNVSKLSYYCNYLLTDQRWWSKIFR